MAADSITAPVTSTTIRPATDYGWVRQSNPARARPNAPQSSPAGAALTRYIARRTPPRAWTDDSPWTTSQRPTLTVYEVDDAPTDTGLLDAHGTPLYRVRERATMGFDLTKRSCS